MSNGRSLQVICPDGKGTKQLEAGVGWVREVSVDEQGNQTGQRGKGHD